MPKMPYVHNSTAELEVMPILARGSNAAIFHTIGLLLPTSAEGATENEIAKYTGLSLKTVQNTLTNLLAVGLIAEQSDKYTVTKYISYGKERKFPPDDDNLSINHQSSNQNQFEISLRELGAMLLPYGGLRPQDYEAFKELWNDCADPETHKRALQITLDSAERPNYKYYEKVVLTGAKTFEKSKTVTYAERKEQMKRAPKQENIWQPPTEAEKAAFRAERAARLQGA